jgi:hypothetical protein
LEKRISGDASIVLPKEVQDLLERPGRAINSIEELKMAGDVLAEAFRQDLRALITAKTSIQINGAQKEQDLDTGLPPNQRLVVLLLDDLHKWALAGPFFWSFLYPDLVAPGSPLRVIFTYSSSRDELGSQGYAGALREIEELLRRGKVLKKQLDKFREPKLDPLPYVQFLLRYDERLVVSATAKEEDRNWFFEELHDCLDGVPSNLQRPHSRELKRILRICKSNNVKLLVDANDEQALVALANEAAAAGGGGAGP